MSASLSAAEVADRLGVELATVYAYASRGSLTRRAGPDGRRSRYDADEVELLARKGRPRSLRRRPGAVDVVIGTTISEIGDGWIRYRGQDLLDLAGTRSFEDVAHLLWTGSLDRPPADDLDPAIARSARRACDALPPGASVTSRLAVAAAAASAILDTGGGRRAQTDGGLVGAALVGALVAALPPVGREAGAGGTVAERLWPRVSPLAPTAPRVAALDLALVLLAEHELATSTLAVRVAASTGAGPAEVLLAGLGAVSGPLHGRAAVRIHQRLLGSASGHGPRPTPAARPAKRSPVRAPRLVDGFGHVVHRRGDPRFAPLHDAVLAMASPSRRTVIEDDLADRAAAGAPPPNVDAALGALGFVARAEPGATEAIFAVARTAGWLAHAFEEADELPLRYRGRTLYRGPR